MELLPITRAAAEAGISMRTLARRLATDTGPKTIRHGRRRFVARADLAEWLAAHRD